MDVTFKNKEVKSIEIDVQVVPLSHSLCEDDAACLYVMHNKPNWEWLEEEK